MENRKNDEKLSIKKNTEHRTQNTEHRTQNTEHRMSNISGLSNCKCDYCMNFFNACYTGNVCEMQRNFVHDRINVHKNGYTPFYVACKNEFLGIAQALYLLNEDCFNVLKTVRNENNPSFTLIESLVIELCRKDTTKDTKNTKNIEIIEWLYSIDNTILDFEDEFRNSLFIIGCIHGSIELIKWLYSKNNEFIYYLNAEKRSCLYMSCLKNRFNIVYWLCELNNDVLYFDKNILSACTHSTLFEYIYSKDNSLLKLQTINFPCRNGNLEICKLIHSRIGLENDHICELFMRACKYGHLEICKWLFQINNDCINYLDEYNRSPLYMSCVYGNIGVTKWILPMFPFLLYIFDVDGTNPFFACCFNGYIDLVKLIYEFDKGIIACSYQKKMSPLKIACHRGHVEICMFLHEIDKTLIKNITIKECHPLVKDRIKLLKTFF